MAEVGPIKIYYPPELKTRPGYTAIRIRAKSLLWWVWLDLEGARSISEVRE